MKQFRFAEKSDRAHLPKVFHQICVPHAGLLRMAEKDAAKVGQTEQFKNKKEQAVQGDWV